MKLDFNWISRDLVGSDEFKLGLGAVQTPMLVGGMSI